MERPPIRIAAIGLAHNHIFGMAASLVAAGAELVAYVPEAHGLGKIFAKAWPDARAVDDARAILDDPDIQLVLGAGVPRDRAPVGIEVMRHGKDFLSDKPGFTTHEQLALARSVAAETGRGYAVCFSERFESRATVQASELVAKGAIGRVLHTVGLGPHRLQAENRPAWHFERAGTGGIINDLASHQIDQFLHFTGAGDARITSARVANRTHPQYPELQDVGELMIEGSGASGYVRVDWFTPDGLATWGDGRLFLMGSEGSIEIRKYVDVAGREGADHLFLIDDAETRHVDCGQTPLPFGAQLLDDVVHRTETAMTQEHAFLASELALDAQQMAEGGA